MKSPKLAGKKLVLAPVGRAGSGFLEGMLNLLPSARVAHIGLYRDPRTLGAVEYFFKAPDDMPDRLALVLHPMLATGNSAVAAIDRLKEAGAVSVRIVCLARRQRRPSSGSARIIPTSISGPPRSTTPSMRRAIFCLALATSATACMARGDILSLRGDRRRPKQSRSSRHEIASSLRSSQ